MSKTVASLLRGAFERKKSENPRFSMEMLARRVGVSRPFVSQLLAGKRALPAELVDSLREALDLDAEQVDWLSRAVLSSRRLKGSAGVLRGLRDKRPGQARPWRSQPKSHFWMLEDWHYIALADATLLRDYDGTPSFLARRLGLSAAVVTGALARMREAGILEEKEGMLRKAENFADFHSGGSKEELRAYHQASLDKAKEELRRRTAPKSLEERLITTATFTVNRNKIPWARQQVAEFLRTMAAALAEGEGEEVYQLSVQLFPLSQN